MARDPRACRRAGPARRRQLGRAMRAEAARSTRRPRARWRGEPCAPDGDAVSASFRSRSSTSTATPAMRAACSTVTSRAITRRSVRLRSFSKCDEWRMKTSTSFSSRASTSLTRSAGADRRRELRAVMRLLPAATRTICVTKRITPARKSTAPQRVTCTERRAMPAASSVTPSAISASCTCATRAEKVCATVGAVPVPIRSR